MTTPYMPPLHKLPGESGAGYGYSTHDSHLFILDVHGVLRYLKRMKTVLEGLAAADQLHKTRLYFCTEAIKELKYWNKSSVIYDTVFCNYCEAKDRKEGEFEVSLGRRANLLSCSICTAAYCSETCQKKDWKRHKEICVPEKNEACFSSHRGESAHRLATLLDVAMGRICVGSHLC